MKINIQAPWEVNDYLAAFTEDAVKKLEQFNQRLIRAKVFFKHKEHTGQKDKMVEIILRGPGPEFFAKSYEETFEKAVIEATHKLKMQLTKRKEKQIKH